METRSSSPEKRSKTDDATACPATMMTTLEHLPPDIFSHNILSFIGANQYRFVGGVNHLFRNAYVALFPKKRTLYNVLTIQHAKICYDDIVAYPFKPVFHKEYEGLGRAPDNRPETLCKLAAQQGNLAVLQYLRSVLHCPWDDCTFLMAAWKGDLQVLQWAHDHQCPHNPTISSLFDAGSLEISMFFDRLGRGWDTWICSCAARMGHLEMLQWARQNDYPWNEATCLFAAKNGHLDVLKWARGKGCPWDEQTCANAAEHGHLDVLKWAHENGCPWDEETSTVAAENDQWDVFQWALQHGCPCDEGTHALAASKGYGVH
jgi:hypothetical protein